MYLPKTIEPKTIQRFFIDKETKELKERTCLIVQIEGEDYDVCVRSSSKFWSNSKKSEYGQGCISTPEDKYRPTRTGKLGEMAYCKLTRTLFDNEYRERGDRQDFLIRKSLKADMKCAAENRNENLVYHTSEKGILIPLSKDIYICSYIDEEDRSARTATVILTGFLLQGDFPTRCKVEKAHGKQHKNWVLRTTTLRPIVPFIQEVRNIQILS